MYDIAIHNVIHCQWQHVIHGGMSYMGTWHAMTCAPPCRGSRLERAPATIRMSRRAAACSCADRDRQLFFCEHSASTFCRASTFCAPADRGGGGVAGPMDVVLMDVVYAGRGAEPSGRAAVGASYMSKARSSQNNSSRTTVAQKN